MSNLIKPTWRGSSDQDEDFPKVASAVSFTNMSAKSVSTSSFKSQLTRRCRGTASRFTKVNKEQDRTASNRSSFRYQVDAPPRKPKSLPGMNPKGWMLGWLRRSGVPRRIHYVCQKLASNPAFSGLTVFLTIYVLLGDDVRLICFEKPTDWIFDIIVVSSIAIYSFEIVVCTIGKAGYIFSFFFYLDILSTAGLVMDITTVNERLLGDSISKEAESDEQLTYSGRSPGEASRAARISRVGNKAGRIIRLLRLVRLVRLLKSHKKGKYQESLPPGMQDWEEEDADPQEESNVSKKLSEMTTKRVIMLVILLMLSIPFFAPEVYTADLPSSAQYGINNLYRSFRDGFTLYSPMANQSQRDAYLASDERQVYVDDFFMYSYYHNPFCNMEDVPSTAFVSPLNVMGKLFWLGVGRQTDAVPPQPPEADMLDYFLPFGGNLSNEELNRRYNGQRWPFYQCNLTSTPRSIFAAMSNVSCMRSIRGVSILEAKEANLDCPQKLRYQERTVLFSTSGTEQELIDLFVVVVFDRRSGVRMESILNIFMTLFIVLLLGGGSMMFSSDANNLVLIPLERVITTVNNISRNPIHAIHMYMRGTQERAAIALVNAKRSSKRSSEQRRGAIAAEDPSKGLRVPSKSQVARTWKSCWLKLCRMIRKACACCSALLRVIWGRKMAGGNEPELMETTILEQTIMRVGALLAVGFGEAGALIIGQNLEGVNSFVCATRSGTEIEAIFGFCTIADFMEVTDVLLDKVQVFVNQIAQLVHLCAHEYYGMPAPSEGHSFLLTWCLTRHPEGKRQKLADMSMATLMQIVARVSKSPDMETYREHAGLLLKFPKFRVSVGLGLHFGKAIEGCIGSDFKVDASYLGPPVPVVEALSHAAFEYGCQVLVTGAALELMSPRFFQECRIIDCVQLSRTTEIFKVYTMDLDDHAFEATPSALVSKKTKLDIQVAKFERWDDSYNLHQIFETDKDIRRMREKFGETFMCSFSMAYLNYEAGEWPVAQSMLKAIKHPIKKEDGPSAALLRFMKEHGGQAPVGWPGYRVLPVSPDIRR